MNESLRKYEFSFTILLLNTTWSIPADTKGVVAVVIGKVKLNNRRQEYMNISSVSSTPNPFQISGQTDLATTAAKSATPAAPANTSVASGAVDSDGDHDGSGLNVTA